MSITTIPDEQAKAIHEVTRKQKRMDENPLADGDWQRYTHSRLEETDALEGDVGLSLCRKW